MVEVFDVNAYAEEQGWDPAAVCSLSDHGAQMVVAAWMVEACDEADRGRVGAAKRNVDEAIRLVKREQEAGRTKQAERAARETGR